MRKLIKRVAATGDDGRPYEVLAFRRYTYAADFDSDGDNRLPGPFEFETANGERLTVMSQGVYKVVQTGVMLTADEPEAL